MAQPRDNDALSEQRPMAEPGPRRGADIGGMASSADGGLRDALQRSSERGDDDAIGGATIGSASGNTTPRLDLGGKSEPGSAAGAPAPSRRAPSEESPADDRSEGSVEDADAGHERSSDPGRADTVAPDGNARTVGHDPDEPPDEGAIESLGRSVSEVVTGPLEDHENRDAGTRSP